MKKEADNEKRLTELVLKDIKTSWWIKDDRTSTITLSNYIQWGFGINSDELSYEEFIAMVREDYRDRIQQELTVADECIFFDQVFPMNTPNGLLWLHAKEIENGFEDGCIVSYGRVQFMDDPEISSPEQASSLRTHNLLYQLRSISQILLTFLQTDNLDDVINSILKDILKQFKAGRTYIFEYNWEKRVQTNTYEVVDDNVKPEMDILAELPCDISSWWTEQIKAHKPIALSTLDDLPEAAANEKNLLTLQDVNSLFVAPLTSKNGVWGYAGVDIVDGFHTWSKEDTEWLLALFNIISLCIQMRRSEKAAQLDKSYLQNLYKNMPLGYFSVKLIYDSQGEVTGYLFTDCNPAAEKLFLEPISNYIGHKINITDVSTETAKIIDHLKTVPLNESYTVNEYYIESSDKYTNLVIYSILQNEIICLFSDITDSYKTKLNLIEAKEKAEISDRLKSAFLANMSHEIRTPMNAIVGFSDLLTETDDKEERQTYSTIVHENNDLLLQLISDILDISKIEAGTLDITYSNVDVNQMCREIIHIYSYKTRSNAIQVTFDSYESSCHIYSDKNRLTQVLSNFINNALKFTHEGGISIGYHLIDNKEKIKFYVHDTGCGISPENLDSIFSRFVKLDSFVPGTGLGLPISRSLIEQMGGEMGVESELGKGSCFWFTLPYRKDLQIHSSKHEAIEFTETPLLKESKSNELPTVLVAEDTESNYLLLSTILKKNYKLFRAYNGLEAINMYKQIQPDIILMDMKMPNMDGVEATKHIRSLDRSVPIIAVTAFAFDSDRERVLNAGCNDYLSKPIKATELINKMETLLHTGKMSTLH